MDIVYVQFEDASEATVVAVFGCPQDPQAYPHQKQIPASDHRYVAFAFPESSRTDVERRRLVAYADPITGSDRHFAEASSLLATGLTETALEVIEVRAKGLARRVEIQAEHPWPA